MSQIDSIGTYRGSLEEAGLGETKNGYPQFVGRIKATEKYIEEADELKHYVDQGVIEEAKPQWINWEAYNEYITAYLVLFKSAEEFNEDTALFHYEGLQLALGWDGDEFDSLNDDTHVGKKLLFRVEENEYNGKVSLQVSRVDAPDANPSRELRKLDDGKVKDLNAKLKIGGKGKGAKPSKPSKPAAKPAAQAESKQEPAPAPETPAAAPPSRAKAESGKPAEQPQEQPESQEQPAGDKPALPTETTKEAAWGLLCDNKGGNSDADVEEAWIAAINEVAGERDEDDLSGTEWAQVRDIATKDLALDV